ncbi:MAG: SWIM zinc finger domain-containing protein [Halobacteriaceae archaeon]
MNITEQTIRDRCPDAVLERGQTYRQEGHIQRLDRVDEVITATVQGSHLYDVTIDVGGSAIESACSCPYDGPGDCKHVVAVLLAVADDPPADASDRIEAVLDDLSTEELRAFVLDAVARDPALRERLFVRFGEAPDKSAAEYRADVEQLFDQHTDEYPVVVEAIDFSPLFDTAEQYRERGRYRAAATVYRGLFEGIDDNIQRVDAAYDHYARAFQSALEGYVACVRAADLSSEERDAYTDVLTERASTGAGVHRDQFRQALEALADAD